MRVGMHGIGVGKTNVLLQNCYKSIGEVQRNRVLKIIKPENCFFFY